MSPYFSSVMMGGGGNPNGILIRRDTTSAFYDIQSLPPPVQRCVPFLVRFDVFWLKQHLLGWGGVGWGEGSGIVCKTL